MGSVDMELLGYLYALLIAVGGLVGFLKAGSFMSLGMGALFGVLAWLAAYRLSCRPDQFWLGLLVSGTMLARFGQNFYQTGAFLPARSVLARSPSQWDYARQVRSELLPDWSFYAGRPRHHLLSGDVHQIWGQGLRLSL